MIHFALSSIASSYRNYKTQRWRICIKQITESCLIGLARLKDVKVVVFDEIVLPIKTFAGAFLVVFYLNCCLLIKKMNA